MGPKPKSKGETSKSKISSKSKDKKDDKKSKDKKEKSLDKSKKEKSSKKLDKSKKEDKSIDNKDNKEKELSNIEEEKKIEEANLIQNLTLKNNNNNIEVINNEQKEKCEGCFNGDAYLFCSDCAKIYCKICDDQLHVVPAYRNHERMPLDSFVELKLTCYHHNVPLRFFCETCHEPICSQCQVMGPHNTPLHTCTSLFVVYRKYFEICKNYLNDPLKEKSQRIEQTMVQIDNLLNANKNKAKEMLHGINLEYEGIIEKITKIDGKKKAVLNYNASELQKDILEIENIISYLNGLSVNSKSNFSMNGNITSNLNNKGSSEEDPNEKMINFLLQYKSLLSSIDQLISKPTNKLMTKEEQNKIKEWPIEINDSKEKLQNYEKYKKILKVKDDIIWKLIITPYEENNMAIREIEYKTQNEVEEWAKLVDKYALELTKYHLVCSFCGGLLENNINNDKCPFNSVEIPYINRALTTENPPKEFVGSDKHYYSPPSEGYEEKISNGEFFDYKKELQDIENKKRNAEWVSQSRSLLNSLKKKNERKEPRDLIKPSFTNDWVYKSARLIEQRNINLYQILSEYDLRNDGTITFRNLVLAFTKIKIILTDEDKDSLEKYINSCGYNLDKIDIRQLSSYFGKTTIFMKNHSDSEKGIKVLVQKSNNDVKNSKLFNPTSNIPNSINNINTTTNQSRDLNYNGKSSNGLGHNWVYN